MATMIELEVSKQEVIDEIKKLGLTLSIDAITRATSTTLSGTTLVIADIEQDMPVDSILRISQQAEAVKAALRGTDTLRHFVKFEISGYLRRDTPSEGKIHGIAVYVLGEDANATASLLRLSMLMQDSDVSLSELLGLG